MTAPVPRFGVYAERYARYRPTYPPALYALLTEQLGTRRHAVDLGAGTGQVALDLLNDFPRVTAVEPDGAMAALIPKGEGLAVVLARAEDADFADGGVDLVTVGTAFHWMDAAAVGARVHRWLRPGGVFAAFVYDRFAAVESPAVQALLDAEAARWTGHKHENLNRFLDHPERIRAAGVFPRVEAFSLPTEWLAEPAEFAGFLMTTSFAMGYARSTGDEAAYAADFTARLAAAAGERPMLIRYPVEGAMGWKE